MTKPQSTDLSRALAELGRSFEVTLAALRAEFAAELTKLRARTQAPDGQDDLLTVGALRKRAGISRSQFYRLLGDPGLDLEGRGIVVRLPGRGRGRIRVRWSAFESWLVARTTTRN